MEWWPVELLLLLCVAIAGIATALILRHIRKEDKMRIVPDDEKECDISVVVVQGRQDHLLLIDDVNKRLIKMHLMPGMRVAAVGVGRRDKEGALCVKAREVDSFDDEDFAGVKQETYFN
jgi:hypothetical protein